MGQVVEAVFTVCAGQACKKRVRIHTQSKKVLCKECWHKKIEAAALLGVSTMHIAFSEGQHEFVAIDNLSEFIDQYDIERGV